MTPTVVGTGVSVSGAPVDGTYLVNYQYSQDTPKARVRKYLGGPAQDLYADLSATVGTSQLLSSDKFAGDVSLIVTPQYDQDAFPSNIPQISAVMRGAKVLDPRTGTTAWTENPALIARDWALYAYGGGAEADEFVDTAFTAAANACDVSTSFVTDAGTEVRPLYQCGIVCPLDADPSVTLGEIVEAMAGQCGWIGGRLTLCAGVYRAPVAAITADWISDKSAIELVVQAPTSDRSTSCGRPCRRRPGLRAGAGGGGAVHRRHRRGRARTSARGGAERRHPGRARPARLRRGDDARLARR